MMRTVPDLERMIMDWVEAPPRNQRERVLGGGEHLVPAEQGAAELLDVVAADGVGPAEAVLQIQMNHCVVLLQQTAMMHQLLASKCSIRIFCFPGKLNFLKTQNPKNLRLLE